MTVLVYLPSLGGGFIAYDDDWLIRDSEFFALPRLDAFKAIWTDFSPSTRLVLGAEYLPIRDTSVLLDVITFGMNPQCMRIANLLLYLLGAYACIKSLRIAFKNAGHSDVIACLFILHPVHVDSVAWIVGRKDVLGLLFFWSAAWIHLARARGHLVLVPVLLALAQLSKFLFVAAPPLLFVLDLLQPRASESERSRFEYVAPCLAVLCISGLQVWVAGATTMIEQNGPTYSDRLLTMGPVWWGYLKTNFFAIDQNIIHDVLPVSLAQPQAFLGYGIVIGAVVFTSALARARSPYFRPTFAVCACFILPLLPASQILAPIQNFHEDRYLVLSTLSAALAWGLLFERINRISLSLASVLVGVCLAYFAGQSSYRAYLFADPIRLFEHATANSYFSGAAPYQLGRSYEGSGRMDEAILAYHTSIMRPDRPSESGRRSTNNLARIYAQLGNLSQAERVLADGIREFPNDPKLAGNLAEIVWRSGRHAEAQALFEQLITRYPDYDVGLQNYRQHFGNQAHGPTKTQ